MSKGRPRKQYELYIDGEYKRTGFLIDLADVVEMKAVLLRKRVNKEMSGLLLKPIEPKPPEYAFYKGEDGPFIGTLADIAEMTGITEVMLEWYGRPSAMERHDTALIKLEDDEMRVRRTNDKYAPILTEEKYNPKPVEKRLKTITRDELQLFLNNYGEGRTRESVRKVSNCIGVCLKDAVYDGYLPKDPTYKVKVEGTVKAKKETEKYFTIDQYLRLIEYFKWRTEKSYIALYLISITGARFSEVNNMTWKDLNYKPGMIHLPGSKSESASRDVEVDERNIQLIKEKLSDHPIKISGELFGLSHNAVLKSIRKAQTDLNFPAKEIKTTHALRHTHCSYLISKEIPIEYISKRLGHSGISVTLSVYSHLLDEYKKTQGERVRQLFK